MFQVGARLVFEVKIGEVRVDKGIPSTNQNHECQPTSSAADAVADVGGFGCIDHPDDFQLDARR